MSDMNCKVYKFGVVPKRFYVYQKNLMMRRAI